jgi:serine/threonine-protein kinase
LTSCPDEDVLAAYAAGALGDAARDAIEVHLDRCVACTEVAVECARLAAAPGDGDRFELLGRLGAGGMGSVHLAHDRLLDRRVALKRVSLRGSSDGEARGRLLREARALARINHPNVVTVYDVVERDGDVHVAMEVVDGPDLGVWLGQGRRARRAILEIFGQAGLGLAAVHEAGLVHRDFKPANVLIGRDGRARVTDFGLVADEDAPAGAIAGTPAYMAPEQRAGGVVGDAGDQYAFCVALREALSGAPPGRPPAWLAAVLDRGLAARPEDRFPSIVALLAAIRAARRARARRAIALAALGLGVLGLGVVAWRVATADPCDSDRAGARAKLGCNGGVLDTSATPRDADGGLCTPDGGRGSCRTPGAICDFWAKPDVGICVPPCAAGPRRYATGGCPRGNRCVDVPEWGGGHCYPDCRRDADCPTGHCDVDGSCFFPRDPGGPSPAQ